MQVAIEATALLGRPTGVGLFTRHLLEQLAQRENLRLTAFAISWRGRDQLGELVPSGVRVVRRPLPARPAHLLWRRFDHPRLERWTGPIDLVHGPNYVVPPADAARVVTVHDLTTVRFPELCTRETLAFPDLVQRAADGGAFVHTVSEYVADEVRRHFDVDPDRVVAVHEGVPTLPPPDPDRGAALAGAPSYLLTIGTIEPRKDHPGLVRAFDRLADARPDLHLVVAGPAGWGQEALTAALGRARHADRITVTGWISDAERSDLLAGAAALVHPARYEGFGFPPLEAMQAGTPVVTTDGGALPEIVGDAALVVPTGDTDALEEAVDRLLSDPGLADRLVAAGRARAAGFTWERTAEGIEALYRLARGVG